MDTRQQRLVKTTRGSSWEGFKIRGEGDGEDTEQQAAKAVNVREGSATPAPPAPEADPLPAENVESLDKESEEPVAPPSRTSGGNQPLFNALLMAATGRL